MSTERTGSELLSETGPTAGETRAVDSRGRTDGRDDVATALSELDVVMLYYDPHPAHRGFASAIDADLIHYREHSAGPLSGTIVEDLVNGLRLPSYDVCLAEGSVPLYAALVGRAATDTDVIYLCADHGLYHVGRDDFEGSSVTKSLIGRFGVPAIRRVAEWGIDGVIAVSDFAAEFTRDVVGEETPIRVAHPYIQPDVYDRLRGCDPALGADVAVTVGRAERYKGVDMLVEAWPRVRERHPDAELIVVGRGHPQAYASTPGVTVEGYVDCLPDVFERASLYVQPSRMDTFPVSTLEAMCAGLPALVTSTTGTASEAEVVDESLVVDPTPDALAAGVAAYFAQSQAARATLSQRARGRGAAFDSPSMKAAFRRQFVDLVATLE